jgi:peptide/nickel transport system substrate-binding protein
MARATKPVGRRSGRGGQAAEWWLRAADVPAQKALAADIQRLAYDAAPCTPLGLYYQPVAYRANLARSQKGLIQFTGVKRI